MKMPYSSITQTVELAKLKPMSPRLNFSASFASVSACPAPFGMPVRIRTTTKIAPSVRMTLWMASVQMTASMPPSRV